MAGSAEGIIRELKSNSSKDSLNGMARFGISTEKALGVSIPYLRGLAKKIGKNHKLAEDLWRTKIHEARILASMIEDPKLVTKDQLEKWVKEFNSWDLCDQCCGNLFDKTEFAYGKSKEWSGRKEEFVKRAGFTLMACLAVHDKTRKDRDFIALLPIIERESIDERNFVRKAVNWALRQIGKRNKNLNRYSIKSAERIRKRESKSARWIANDALRELRSDSVRVRLNG